MHNIWIIARREYLERVRTRAFFIMTIFIPALMFGVTVLPSLIAMRMSGGNKHLIVATTDRQTGELIRQQLQKPPETGLEMQSGNSSGPSKYDVDLDTNISDSERAALNEKVKQKQADGVI